MPNLLDVAKTCFADVPFLNNKIDQLVAKYGNGYIQFATQHLEALFAYLHFEQSRFEEVCHAFLEMTFEIMRLQNSYYQTGQFALDLNEAQRSNLYQNPELMRDKYLIGLYLAQVFWENHFEKLLFFQSAFLPLLQPNYRLLDVGSGAGTYTLLALRCQPSCTIVANDISPLSSPIIKGLAQVMAGVPDNHIVCRVGDFAEIFAHESFDAIVFSEVVEHLNDPEKGMACLSHLVAPHRFVFFSTATNAAFYDHTIVFNCIADIVHLVEKHGFKVVNYQEILAFKGPNGLDVIDYNAILQKVC